MSNSDRAQQEVYLRPGDFYFGDQRVRIRTLLGSCVSITLWHPQRLIGGMCHYMLPGDGRVAAERLDGRYAPDALALFSRELQRNSCLPCDFDVKLFGGGRMFMSGNGMDFGLLDVGIRNIDAGRQLLHRHGFAIKAEHLAGDGHRTLVFDIATGDVWVRHCNEVALSAEKSKHDRGRRS
ncbi:MAG: chemotaxis protein CheD [Gammaproteobacteria bacterium]|nr:chemotaxis protein CheD [Gammaproteobacteria bacterium]